MFEEMSTLPKGKGKGKDVGKRRGYVRVVTSLGGSLNLELHCEKVEHRKGFFAPLLMRCTGTQDLLQFLEISQGW